MAGVVACYTGTACMPPSGCLDAMANAAPYRGALQDRFDDDRIALGIQGEAALLQTEHWILAAVGWLHAIDGESTASLSGARLLLDQLESCGRVDPLSIGGQFTAIAYHRKTSHLVCIRDLAGSYPLHAGVGDEGKSLYLASDIRQVSAGQRRPLSLNLAALRRMQDCFELPAPATPTTASSSRRPVRPFASRTRPSGGHLTAAS